MLPAQALTKFRERLDASDFRLPPGYSVNYGGEEEQRQSAVGDLLAPVSVLVLAMLGMLVLSFNSFRLAGVIGTVGFLSIGLGLLALLIFGYPLGFMAIIGMLGLVGVAINDSIVVLANIRANPEARDGDRKALRGVVVGSTRHVIATSLTTVAGFTPLYLAGGYFWPPLAVTVAGGVAGATLLALFYLPSAYIVLHRKRFSMSSAKGGVLSPASTPAPADAG